MDISIGEVPAAKGNLAKVAADEIEKCVHCGFCTAACPTYTLDHNELDSPRGRIYLVKRLLENGDNARAVQTHLDRCLSCRSCEPACPSGVGYSTIAHAGREIADATRPRPFSKRFKRALIAEAARSRMACKLGKVATRALGPLAPKRARLALAPSPAMTLQAPKARHGRKAAVLAGCAQAGLMPETNTALATLLDLAGFDATFLKAPCCGAIRAHNGRGEQAMADAKRTLAECKSGLQDGAEAVLVAASGCGSFLTEYPSLLAGDKDLASAAKEMSAKVADPASFLLEHLDFDGAKSLGGKKRKVAAHVPCTLANGLRAPDAYATLLAKAGFDVVRPEDPPNCCGSAGTYSLFNPGTASRLLGQLQRGVEATAATELVTANIGCALHIRQRMQMPVNHWIDVLASALAKKGREENN